MIWEHPTTNKFQKAPQHESYQTHIGTNEEAHDTEEHGPKVNNQHGL